jgi:hypothetical protein
MFTVFRAILIVVTFLKYSVVGGFARVVLSLIAIKALVVKGFAVGDTFNLNDCTVQAYKMGADRVGLSIDKW